MTKVPAAHSTLLNLKHKLPHAPQVVTFIFLGIIIGINMRVFPKGFAYFNLYALLSASLTPRPATALLLAH